MMPGPRRYPRRRRAGWLAAAMMAGATSFVALPEPALAVAGGLDPTWSGDGTLPLSYFVTAIAPYGNGVVLAGKNDNTATATMLVRSESGLPVTSFSGDGAATFQIRDWNTTVVDAIETNRGGIVAAVSGQVASGGTWVNFPGALIRLTASGSFDRSFSGGGQYIVDLGRADVGVGMSPIWTDQAGNLSAIVAVVDRIQGVRKNYLLRLRADGTAVPGFGVRGMVRIGTEGRSSVHFAPDGGFYVATSVTTDRHVIARYRLGGALDTRFGGDGRVTAVCSFRMALEIDARGRAVVFCNPADQVATVQRYTRSGALDSTFSGDGRATIRLESDGARGDVDRFTVDALNRPIVVGRDIDDTRILVAQLRPSGALDMNFDGDGVALVDVGGFLGGRAPIGTGERIYLAGRVRTHPRVWAVDQR